MGEELTLPIIIVAAAVDSINPCVFGVLIFLIAFMTRMFKSASKMLIFGLLYGFGILKIAIDTNIATTFYWLAALIAIFAGLLEIKDYFWYGKGPSLQIIPGGGDRIKYYTNKIENMEQRHPALLILTTALLGVFVVLIELPCTGAPYLAVLGLLSKGEFATAVPMLLIYNFVFVIPLFVIIGISYFGTTSETLENWRKEHRGLMRLGIGIFLLLLGFYMIYSLNPVI
jgi:cytochrome c biogenesis protein CcdA